MSQVIVSANLKFVESARTAQLFADGELIAEGDILFDPETGAYYDEDGELIARDTVDRSGW